MWLVVNVVAHPRLDLGVLIDVARSNPLSERLWKLGGERLLGARARLALRLQHRAELAQRTRLHLGGLVGNVIHPRTAKLWEVKYCWRSSATRSAQPSAASPTRARTSLTADGRRLVLSFRPVLLSAVAPVSCALRQPRSLVARTVACCSSVCFLARPLSVSAHQTEVTNLSRSHDAKAKHQTKQSSRAVAR